jgi:hypothetical protein
VTRSAQRGLVPRDRIGDRTIRADLGSRGTDFRSFGANLHVFSSSREVFSSKRVTGGAKTGSEGFEFGPFRAERGTFWVERASIWMKRRRERTDFGSLGSEIGSNGDDFDDDSSALHGERWALGAKR